jgi:hypothetical protein
MTREQRRGARSLPRRTRSRWEYSGTRRATTVTETADRRGSSRSRSSDLPCRVVPARPPDRSAARRWRSRRANGRRRHPPHQRLHFTTQHRPALHISTRQRTENQVLWCQLREHADADQFPQTSLQSIPRHTRLPMLRHDEANPRERQRGSRDAELEMSRPHTLPLTSHPFQIRLSRETLVSREPERLRRRRTCSAAALSAACGPSFGDGRG